ncbi:hypothetical protein TD95_000893 [Thielaviopsis punctulata]|uniref:Piwi domain-containing protein n=1 Tax=Thielaviopsis punctulata TaxID=72032 RepID=A0A0F4ZFR5_9PEZI|nr:hypothetical protein TD95_000893 [Thielaviopsis punctulata]
MSASIAERPQGALGNTRLDLPAEAYQTGKTSTVFPSRTKYNQSGKPAIIRLNHFRINSIKSTNIWQYDVSGKYLGEREPRNIDILIAKAWKTAECQKELESHKSKWLYDGRKLAWSTVKIDNLRFKVNLDATNSDNTIELRLRPTTKIDLSRIASYVEGNSDMNNGVLESINFLDHLIRQFPSENHEAIRRSFYSLAAERRSLSSFADCVKGTYASVRLNQVNIGPFSYMIISANLLQTVGNGGLGVGVNVDVANTAFWRQGLNLVELTQRFLHETSRQKRALFDELAKVKNFTFFCPCQRAKGINIIHKFFRWVRDPEYGDKGCTSDTKMIEVDGSKISLTKYFEKKYKVKLNYTSWPLIETTKRGTFFPAELCVVMPLQRYPHKLDAAMTSEMIKIAVTPPVERKRAIEEGCQALRWNTDPYLKHFGVKINNSFAETQARVLPPPSLTYARNKMNPGTSGRWMIRGESFFKGCERPLEKWAVINGAGISKPDMDHFIRSLVQIYRSHGGRISENGAVIDDSGSSKSLSRLRESLKKHERPFQYVFYITNSKAAHQYEQIKRFFDCEVGIMSQVVQAQQVRKKSPQYVSNVCMKMNAKLGGISWIAGISPNIANPKTLSMFIGVDVSHSPVGMEMSSMASMTMSYDRHVARYGAAVETNGFRREILTAENVHTLLGRLYAHWTAPSPPTNVYYLRDGVSEGQFQHVLDEEVPQMKEFFRSKGASPKMTVIIATKRHHIRFFPAPNSLQNKGNPLPGTLVEKEVTHPRHFDFYLCSHAAIKGTARPVHYHVIMDETKNNEEKLQQMLYEQCYQYIRSTTPVSLHPAVYYAHLASNRARAHDDPSREDGKLAMLGGNSAKSREFHRTMWYI